MSKNIKRTVELITNSTERLVRGLALPKSKSQTRFLRREAWIHFKRSAGLLWGLYTSRSKKGE